MSQQDDEIDSNSPQQLPHELPQGKGVEFEEQAPTPFDHPLFLPVLLSGLTLWFGYDGWLNDDPDMAEHLTFNRVGFGALLIGAIYFGIRGYNEWKDDQS